jgi:Na+-driven multidrug efflux pump
MGVAGAALATFIAVAAGTSWLVLYFLPKDAYLKFMPSDWRPRPRLWAAMLKIGLPAGAEFALMAVYLFVVYTISRPFGSAAQAGFGIGMRIVQAGFMPVVALGFSAGPVAGQNFGARQAQRVRDTFRSALILSACVMVPFTVLAHLVPTQMVRLFSNDPQVLTVGDEYLRIISWNFLASGIVFVNSSMFQAIGNTIPSLVSSLLRIVLVGVPAFLLARMPGFELHWVWYISVGAVTLQMVMSLLLLRREFGRRLNFEAPAARAEEPAAELAPVEAV